MAIETKEQVEQFIALQAKNETELRALCESLKLPTEGNREYLLSQLLSLEAPQFQRSVVQPQVIPLCTRGPNGNPLQSAIETMKKWRRLIFEGVDNIRQFELFNKDGKSYSTELRYAKCTQKTLKTILKQGWYMAHTNQRDLIKLLKECPEKFDINIVRKADRQGNSWLMLHIAPQREKVA